MSSHPRTSPRAPPSFLSGKTRNMRLPVRQAVTGPGFIALSLGNDRQPSFQPELKAESVPVPGVGRVATSQWRPAFHTASGVEATRDHPGSWPHLFHLA